jgi:hypothetical protein
VWGGHSLSAAFDFVFLTHPKSRSKAADKHALSEFEGSVRPTLFCLYFLSSRFGFKSSAAEFMQ